MLALGFASSTPASSKYATLDCAQAARLHCAKDGSTNGVGLDEFTDILIKGKMI